MSVIDCRGLACPQPVITTKQALEQVKEGEIIVIVDNSVSCNNVERFARSQGCSVDIKEEGQQFHIRIQKGKTSSSLEASQEKLKAQKIIVYINSHLLGIGDDALGAILMGSFLKTLIDLDPKPTRLILINSGVRLASEGSEVLEVLQTLSGSGVDIFSCGTCLDFYGLKEKLRVGKVSNMYDIAQSLLESDRLIRP
ncbi:MAG: sulfurtransferase-like selenium metabolism protein YedF [Deltaproteobacteria bacterium]|nr:sulfurtransferase-like selenium metabolism protein YedF [Deltaproteobacteria bacterium]